MIDKIENWVHTNYPKYQGYKLEVMANEYMITDGLGEIGRELAEKCEQNDWFEPSPYEFKYFEKEITETIYEVEPPEGFIFVTMVKDGHRVGFNVPRGL